MTFNSPQNIKLNPKFNQNCSAKIIIVNLLFVCKCYINSTIAYYKNGKNMCNTLPDINDKDNVVTFTTVSFLPVYIFGTL